MHPEKRAWIWPILIMVTIFTLSGTSHIATPDIGFQTSKDKIGHFLVFGLLATSILRIPRITRLGWMGALIAAVATTAFGGFDEFRQSLTPGRTVEFADWIADTAGAIVAVIAYRTLTIYRLALEWALLREREKPSQQTRPE